jgi:hypothetical protein
MIAQGRSEGLMDMIIFFKSVSDVIPLDRSGTDAVLPIPKNSSMNN